MARKTINPTTYTFTPGASGVGKVVIPQYIARERLILITNVNKDLVIYNFSDPSRLATSYSATVSGATGSTTIVFSYNTSSMSSTDKLSIVIDEYAEKFQPVEELYDPVGKFRVSTPQSLIDTDFEYGNQTSKWEAIGATNWHPAAYNLYPPISQPTNSLATVASISIPIGSKTVTVTTSGAHGYVAGQPISVQDSQFMSANGNFVIESVTTSGFTYSAKAVNTSNALTSIFDPYKTQVWQQQYYTNAAIGGAPTVVASGNLISVTTTVPHTLHLGNEIAITGTATAAVNGNFFVTGITSASGFTYFVPSGTISSGAITATSASVYARNQSMFAQRPFDGGVLFGSQSLSNLQSSIRQTRRNFHYQSGKGLEMATGTILKTSFIVDSLTSNGTAIGSTITIQTREQHNLTPGLSINIAGVATSGYNGNYLINTILNATQFTVLATTTLGNTSPTDSPGVFAVTVNGWYGSNQRMGLFSQENGIFFDFDGQQLYAVLRSSTKQLSGRVTATQGSTILTQTDSNFPTIFSKQLTPGQYIVIRGLSYRVTDIISDTQINISPAYRGITASYVTMTATVDTVIPQNQWNIDRLDGTGPSGYTIDYTKMQMWYVDYSWYGSGFIRWGIRTTDGQIQFCHKLANNNINTVAYMRSGNLPGRYETSNLPPLVTTTSSVLSTDTTLQTTSTLNAAGTSAFPASGTLLIRNYAVGTEYVNYTAVTTSGFSGLTRGVATTTTSGTYLALTMASGQTVGFSSSTISGVQVGMRVVPSGFPDNTYVSSIVGSGINFSNAYYGTSNPTVVFQQMGLPASNFTFSSTSPTIVELATPSHSPLFSHWGTAVTMDGGFDQDKNLLFTYGQTLPITLASGQTKALMSIRLAPSVDNSQISSLLGSHELTNRVQLQLQTLDVAVTASGAPSLNVGGGNVLIKAYLNATPVLISGGTIPAWVNAVSNVNTPNSSLSQIADYSSVTNGVTTASGLFGGEATAGFFVSTTQEVDVSKVRDLGNSILSGGGTGFPNTGIYPDGPDTLTLVAQNVGVVPVNILARVSWVEPQA